MPPIALDLPGPSRRIRVEPLTAPLPAPALPAAPSREREPARAPVPERREGEPVPSDPREPARADPREPVPSDPREPARADPREPARAGRAEPGRADPREPLPA